MTEIVNKLLCLEHLRNAYDRSGTTSSNEVIVIALCHDIPRYFV